MLWRIEVQADDIGFLALEIGIIAGHVAFQTVRLQTSCAPDPMHHVFADTQFLRQLAAGPVGRSIARLATSCRQYLGLQLRCDHARLLPGWRSCSKPSTRCSRKRFLHWEMVGAVVF